jgi:hypothetical protein
MKTHPTDTILYIKFVCSLPLPPPTPNKKGKKEKK